MEDHLIPKELPRLLLAWYSAGARVLPWRETRDPYKIWISEIMLQQTRIAAAMDYYRRFLAALPDIPSLAAVEDDILLKLWQGLGYYNRARNLKKAAQILVANYGGEFPRSFDAIRSLPGIGDYTAGAVASIAFGTPVPAVDGNVLRVLTRVLCDKSDISKEKTKALFREKLIPVLPQNQPGAFNQAIMELGEQICLPNGEPLCEKCPLADLCLAKKENRIQDLPVKSAAKPRRIEERNVYLIFHDGKIALRKRPEKGLLAGLWEPPQELSSTADPLESWGIAPSSVPVLSATGIHIFSHIEWHMKAYSLFVSDAVLPDGWVWASQEDLEQIYALPNAFLFVQGTIHSELSAVPRCPAPPK